MEWIYLLIGVVIGSLVTATTFYIRNRTTGESYRIEIARLQAELQAESGRVEWSQIAREELQKTFAALAGEALASNKGQFLTESQKELKGLVDPLAQSLKQMDEHVRALESKRSGDHMSLSKQLDQLAAAQSQLRDSAVSLRRALQSSTERGSWGEYQLERVLNLSGMTKNIHYELQPRTEQGQPDARVFLPNEGILPIDAKAPVLLSDSGSGETTEIEPADAAQAIRSHVVALSRREYWKAPDSSAGLVVMFVPSEAIFSKAFDHDPTLLDYCIERHILLTTPITLLALLKTVAYGWQQLRIAEHAEEIAEEGAKLHDRVVVFFDHVLELGKRLDKAVEFYNKAIGSYQTRLRKTLEDFKDRVGSTRELPDPEQVERRPQLAQDSSDELPETSEIRKIPGLPEAPEDAEG